MSLPLRSKSEPSISFRSPHGQPLCCGRQPFDQKQGASMAFHHIRAAQTGGDAQVVNRGAALHEQIDPP